MHDQIYYVNPMDMITCMLKSNAGMNPDIKIYESKTNKLIKTVKFNYLIQNTDIFKIIG